MVAIFCKQTDTDNRTRAFSSLPVILLTLCICNCLRRIGVDLEGTWKKGQRIGRQPSGCADLMDGYTSESVSQMSLSLSYMKAPYSFGEQMPLQKPMLPSSKNPCYLHLKMAIATYFPKLIASSQFLFSNNYHHLQKKKLIDQHGVGW